MTKEKKVFTVDSTGYYTKTSTWNLRKGEVRQDILTYNDGTVKTEYSAYLYVMENGEFQYTYNTSGYDDVRAAMGVIDSWCGCGQVLDKKFNVVYDIGDISESGKRYADIFEFSVEYYYDATSEKKPRGYNQRDRKFFLVETGTRDEQARTFAKNIVRVFDEDAAMKVMNEWLND